MRPRPFLLLIAGIALALIAAGDADAGPDDMVAHWSFDEGEGTTAYDSSGNGNDGTLENGKVVFRSDLRQGPLDVRLNYKVV